MSYMVTLSSNETLARTTSSRPFALSSSKGQRAMSNET